jgi:hypothetical protein
MKVAQADILIVPGYKNSGPGPLAIALASASPPPAASNRTHGPNPCGKTGPPASPNASTRRNQAGGGHRPFAGRGDRRSGPCRNATTDRRRLSGGAARVATTRSPAKAPDDLRPLPAKSRCRSRQSWWAAATTRSARSSMRATSPMHGDRCLIDAGESGHINAESGHGPWPEGIMVFAHFLVCRLESSEAIGLSPAPPPASPLRRHG